VLAEIVEIPAAAWSVLRPYDLAANTAHGGNEQLFDVAIGLRGAPAESVRTGAPGRPTPAHLVVMEFKRRAESGELAENVSTESKQLAAWLKREHPSLPALTAKTIRNRIASDFRTALPSDFRTARPKL
jgi:hypothetical protein